MKILKIKVFKVDELTDNASKNKAIGEIREFYTASDFVYNDLIQMCISHMKKIGVTLTDLDLDLDLSPDQISIRYMSCKNITVNNKLLLSHVLTHDMYCTLEKKFPNFKKLTLSMDLNEIHLTVDNSKVPFTLFDIENKINNFSMRKYLASKLNSFYTELTGDDAMITFAKSSPEDVFYFYEDGRLVEFSLL